MSPGRGERSLFTGFSVPLRGWALVSGLTPGLRPGLLSLRPSGAGLKTGASFATEIKSVLPGSRAQVQAMRRIETMRIGGVSFCSLAGAA